MNVIRDELWEYGVSTEELFDLVKKQRDYWTSYP